MESVWVSPVGTNAEKKKCTLSVKILLSPFEVCNVHSLCGSVFSFPLAVWLGVFFFNYKINITDSDSKVNLSLSH